MTYTTMLDLSVRHDYYPESRCLDCSLAPSPTTERWLLNRRCVLKPRPGGLSVAVPTEREGHPVVPWRNKTDLLFHLVPTDETLTLVTALSSFESRTPRFRNESSNDANAGELAFEIEAGSRLPQGALAEVSLALPASDRVSALAYRLSLPVQSFYWVYYCVTDLMSQAGDLELIDTTSEAEGGPLIFTDRRDLVQLPDLADPVAIRLAARFPSLRRYRFMSDRALPCQAVHRRHLELRLGSDRLAGLLALPSLDHFAAFKDPDLADAMPEPPFLFRVVRYLSRPFASQGER